MLQRFLLLPQQPSSLVSEQKEPQKQQKPDIIQPVPRIIRSLYSLSIGNNHVLQICSKVTSLLVATSSDTGFPLPDSH